MALVSFPDPRNPATMAAIPLMAGTIANDCLALLSAVSITPRVISFR
jgi:hypothetical protein